MSSRNNKNRNKIQDSQGFRDEYNLKKSLDRLNQNQNANTTKTSTGHNISQNLGSSINSSSLNANIGDATGYILQINESMNHRFDSLKNDISCIPEKISSSTDGLRAEIELKLDKKVNDKLFYGAISVVVIIASLFYLFSYSNVLNDTKENTDDLSKFKPQIEHLDRDYKTNKDELSKLKDRVKVIEDSVNKR